MIGTDCPTPTQGPIPCPSTVEQHLDKIRKILPRGIAWLAVYDPLQPMYQYWRAIASTFQWANDQFCLMIYEMFCSSRNVLIPDYLIEYGLPDPCNPNLDPCSLIPNESARCEDLIIYAAEAGWDLSCSPTYQAGSGCAVSGCDASGRASPGFQLILVDTENSPIFTPGESAACGIGASGVSNSGCFNSGPGTLDALTCLIGRFLPAHIDFSVAIFHEGGTADLDMHPEGGFFPLFGG